MNKRCWNETRAKVPLSWESNLAPSAVWLTHYGLWLHLPTDTDQGDSGSSVFCVDAGKQLIGGLFNTWPGNKDGWINFLVLIHNFSLLLWLHYISVWTVRKNWDRLIGTWKPDCNRLAADYHSPKYFNLFPGNTCSTLKKRWVKRDIDWTPCRSILWKKVAVHMYCFLSFTANVCL